MDNFSATEQAYKNGYEKGRQDALRWIPVTERLPETTYRTMVIVCVDGEKSAARWFERTTIRGKLVERFKYPWDVITCENITHWMPLPDAPKGE